MKNLIQRSKMLRVAATSGGVSSGDPVLIGAIFGIAATDAAEGAELEIATAGVFVMPKAAGETWSVGDNLYWDSIKKNLTKSSTIAHNTLVATAAAMAGSNDTSGTAKII